jgi:hypothetical protein
MPADKRRLAAMTARVTTPLALIEKLAVRDATGEIRLLPDGSRQFRVMRQGSCSTTAAFVAFLEARENGWLCIKDETRQAWGLSRAGAVALRQARSAGSGPAQTPARTGIPAFGSAAIDPTESPLAWLRRRKDKSGEPLITARQFDAGERLRADLHYAQMGPRVTVNWSANGGSPGKSGGGLGVDIRDNVAGAQQRVRRALTAVGSTSAGLLIDVCGHLLGLERIERDRSWPPRSGKVALQIALSELANHYGLPGADAGVHAVATKLRHWGVDGYRPAADAVE